MSEKRTFFISRAGADRRWAELIASVVNDAGHEAIHEDQDFKVGVSISHNIMLAAESDCTIAVLSPAYFESQYCLAELHAALNSDPLGVHGRIIPVLVAPCELPRLLGHLAYLDLVGTDEDTARQRLLDALLKRGKEAQYRHLTDQPATPKPDLGSIKELPPKPRPRPSSGPLPPSGGPCMSNPYEVSREELAPARHIVWTKVHIRELTKVLAAMPPLTDPNRREKVAAKLQVVPDALKNDLDRVIRDFADRRAIGGMIRVIDEHLDSRAGESLNEVRLVLEEIRSGWVPLRSQRQRAIGAIAAIEPPVELEILQHHAVACLSLQPQDTLPDSPKGLLDALAAR